MFSQQTHPRPADPDLVRIPGRQRFDGSQSIRWLRPNQIVAASVPESRPPPSMWRPPSLRRLSTPACVPDSVRSAGRRIRLRGGREAVRWAASSACSRVARAHSVQKSASNLSERPKSAWPINWTVSSWILPSRCQFAVGYGPPVASVDEHVVNHSTSGALAS